MNEKASARHYRMAAEKRRQTGEVRYQAISHGMACREALGHLAQALWCIHRGQFAGARAELNLAGMR